MENGMVPANNGRLSLVDPLEQSVGDVIGSSLYEEAESDMRLAASRRALEGAQRRLRSIKEDFDRMFNDLKNNYSAAEAGLVELHVESCRPSIESCYMSVNRQVATTKAGREMVSRLIDRLMDETLTKIRALAPKEEVVSSDPLPEQSEAETPSRKRKKKDESSSVEKSS